MLSIATAASTSFAAPSTPLMRQRAPGARMIAQQEDLKSPLPWMERPAYLDGSLAADVGLDPLNFVEKYSEGVKFKLLVGEFDKEDTEFIFGPNTKDAKRSLMWMREAEIKHCRLAMLAAAGWPLAELWHGPFSRIFGLPYALEATQGRSLSVLNGGLGEVAPFLFFVFLAISAVEVSTLDQVYGMTVTGKTMKKDGTMVMKSYVPGDCGFDPLGLYDWYGQQMPIMVQIEAENDPEYTLRWQQFNRKEMETAEIKNGRLAMLGITGFAFQEAVWGTPVVDQTPIFFTFFGDVLAPGALASLGLF